MQGSERDFSWLKELIFWLVHVAHAKYPQKLDCCHEYTQGQEHIVSDTRVD